MTISSLSPASSPASTPPLLTGREIDALRNFERRCREMDAASRHMISAIVELRDARAGADAKYKF